MLKERVADRLGPAQVESLNNDNSLFQVLLKAAGPVPETAAKKPLALVVAGVCTLVGSASEPEADGTIRLQGRIEGKASAEKVSAELGVKPRLRRHPGHRLHVSFAPEHDAYRPGEPVKLMLTIENVGDVPITFMDGGMQRGPRNNQFQFLAYRSAGWGKAVPDTGDPANFGGMGSFRTLAPGETFTKPAELSNWFRFDAPDSYRITGIYRMTLTDPANHSLVLWDELAAGECHVRVAEQPEE